MVVLTYDGFDLEAIPGGYQSKINGEVVKFDTASQWKQFIDYQNNGKGRKSSNRG